MLESPSNTTHSNQSTIYSLYFSSQNVNIRYRADELHEEELERQRELAVRSCACAMSFYACMGVHAFMCLLVHALEGL